MRKTQDPPFISGMQYKFCQPLTEIEKQRQKKWKQTTTRIVEKETGEKKYGHRYGMWHFWDSNNNKMAEGSCLPKPPHKRTDHDGSWNYWNEEGLQVKMHWEHGIINGIWTLYNKENEKIWEFLIKPGEARKEIFVNEKQLEQYGLRKSYTNKTSSKQERHHDS
ncbi:MAG: hypothetical protein KDK51_06490 [Deltaproteobacteria bacterium]|nr:hypothetical protein [Deltaproteobacteria bacterium]